MFVYQDDALLVLAEGTNAQKALARPVLRGIGVTVTLEGEQAKRLSLHSCGQEQEAAGESGAQVYMLEYRDEEEPAQVSVRVKLKCRGGMVLGFVDGQLHGGASFVSRKSFASKDSIAVTVDRLEHAGGLLANYQHNDWWTRPHFDPDPAKLPPRTISLLWRAGAAYCRLLPVCGPVFRTDLQGNGGDGQGFSIRLSSNQGGHQRNMALAFALGYGDDPYALADMTMDAALEELLYPVLPRERKTYPEVLDYLGWCTWDAFYQQVDEPGVLAKAEEFNRLGLPVRWVMIDDGWSCVQEGKLMSLEADNRKFPGGLARTVQALKEQYGMRWIGVWHTIAGYWEGIHPASPLASSLGSYLYTATDGSLLPYPDPALGFGFWNEWHGRLRRQGIDFVKADSQAAIGNFLQYQRPVGAAASAAHQALEASAALHFNKTIINCMGMAPENIWHRPQSAVSRNSDDFMPKVPGGFREHALQNAYNSYFHGSFYWGDWDMFWTVHPDALQHAVLRSISGGPVYISDPPGRTAPSLLLPLVYGDGRLIRCRQPALPTADCLTVNPLDGSMPLKLWNYAGRAGIIAAFHLGEGPKAAKGAVSARDIPGMNGKRVILYEHFTGECRLLQPGEELPFILQPGQCKLFVLAAVEERVTPLGLVNKYVSPHGIMGQWSGGGKEYVRLREGGRFAFYTENCPSLALVNGEEKPVTRLDARLFEVDCSGIEQEAVVEIAAEWS
ncbi:Sip1-related alpha-galactosidase [Paenibacillus sp. YN15]|uniref:Sip1-related alpha-galactosidase n=1 Tax=Paenibacillus sp. YN15 TaxID=1742774 RepID=UPI000DCC5EDE|nr:Sip1-related alpha-galactosidase [Paenibacillus sp. YN15]RAU92596.1 hypothetical protein DQG13_27280 [Paenibacillus sp. YN15]